MAIPLEKLATKFTGQAVLFTADMVPRLAKLVAMDEAMVLITGRFGSAGMRVEV